MPKPVSPDVGDPAPEFDFPAADGSRVRLSALLSKGPVLLLFIRGTW